MSSRNRYLIQEERRRAGAIRAGLFTARTEFQAGERDGKELLVIAHNIWRPSSALQYLELFGADTLEPVESPATSACHLVRGSLHRLDAPHRQRIARPYLPGSGAELPMSSAPTRRSHAPSDPYDPLF
ncbi:MULTISPECIES: pantoate--beta-alanine ligase [unclassified Bradyrhizobium]|uniref:pantoate--beta-alanine ligase n=1 Tax=unclassified Bradyrhizobium TaxID=2631580 RepID=UPI001FFBDE48|nr:MULTISPECIES: pantoate--beta-alanine ligase [unclassified Bradyrhizobium]